MIQLNQQQKESLLQYLKEFNEKETIVNEGIENNYKSFDAQRISAIPHLKELIERFLNKKLTLEQFKIESESYCRKYPYWGFKNFSGQMQLNQYSNNIKDSEKEEFLREVITLPNNIQEAKNKIDSMADYLIRLKEGTDNPKSIPRVSQAYLLSYFWEIQDSIKWATYYGSTKKVLLNLGAELDVADSYGEEYAAYIYTISQIKELYEKEGDMKVEHPLWFIEHVLWNQFIKNKPVEETKEVKNVISTRKVISAKKNSSAGEWIPPIVTDIEELSNNKETDWSKSRGLKAEKAFETKLRLAFTLLGYETRELGQGTGRQPDGIAVSTGVDDGDYAIIYDAKAREGKYSVGTNDREILEYIKKKTEELKRARINRTYFVVISSEFDDNSSSLNLLKEVYRKTRVPITLLKASDLLFIIETKLENIYINHGQLEHLFLETGLLTREKISDILGVR